MGSRKRSISDKNFSKLQQLVHYVLWYYKQDKNNNLGVIKLNKIIWLLDVWQYCHAKQSMSGEQYYIRKRLGPVPPHIKLACEALNKKGVLEINGYTKGGSVDISKIKINEQPKKEDIAMLNEDELREIKRFCKKLKSADPKKLSEYSHDIIYDSYKENEKIPLVAYLVSRQIKPTEKAIAWAKKSLEIQKSS